MRFAKVPKRPTDYVPSDDLLHDLLLALKDVVLFESTLLKGANGKGNGYNSSNGKGQTKGKTNGNGNGTGSNNRNTSSQLVPDSEFAKLTLVIQKITELHSRLSRRNLDDEVEEALVKASSQIGLDLRQLLQDCLQFPIVIPYSRNLNGLRRLFLCHCGDYEACDRHGLGLCKECIDAALECLQEKKTSSKFILYTSYSRQVRCRHADFSTLLITFYKPGVWLPPWCEICLKLEKERLAKKD